MPRKTVIGVFENSAACEPVIKDLEKNDFEREEIELVAKDATGKYATTFGQGMTGGAAAGTALDLVPLLETRGVPRQDATYYSNCVQRGQALIMVGTNKDKKADKAVDILLRHGARGPIAGETGMEPGRAQTERAEFLEESARERMETEGVPEATIPVVEEELKVGKREVERGRVRIYEHVTEKPVEQEINLREERAKVERHPVDRPATAADIAAQEKVVEVTETAEEPVVQKESRVVEEVEIGKESTEHKEKIRDTVKRTDVNIEEEGKEKKKPD